MIWILGVLPTSEVDRTGRKGILSCIHERNSLRIKRKKKNKKLKILMTIFKLPKKKTTHFLLGDRNWENSTLYGNLYLNTALHILETC